MITGVTLWNLANYGWTCKSETDFGHTSVSVWTRDDQVLTVSWQGLAEATAAILDGEPLPLHEIREKVTADEMRDDPAAVMERASQHAARHLDSRLGAELCSLLATAATLERRPGAPALPSGFRVAVTNLALAVLSTSGA